MNNFGIKFELIEKSFIDSYTKHSSFEIKFAKILNCSNEKCISDIM